MVLFILMSLEFEKGDPIYDRYINYCQEIIENDATFAVFRGKRSAYHQILEHCSKKYADEFIKLMHRDYLEILNKLNWDGIYLNDSVGGPQLHMFPELKRWTNNIYFSTPTILYLFYGLKMLTYMREIINKSSISIVEIGGGYGGQCRMLFELAPYFNINIISYDIFDLKAPCGVIKKYLSKFNLLNKVNCQTLSDIEKFKEYDFMISNWCFSEITRPYQDEYFEKIITKSEHGFILWNHFPDLYPGLTKDRFNNLKIVPEVPKTGEFNKIVLY